MSLLTLLAVLAAGMALVGILLGVLFPDRRAVQPDSPEADYDDAPDRRG